ncbi:hypothetical protein HDV05_004935, partial [Chytridiales sp. JEL 0842]
MPHPTFTLPSSSPSPLSSKKFTSNSLSNDIPPPAATNTSYSFMDLDEWGSSGRPLRSGNRFSDLHHFGDPPPLAVSYLEPINDLLQFSSSRKLVERYEQPNPRDMLDDSTLMAPPPPAPFSGNSLHGDHGGWGLSNPLKWAGREGVSGSVVNSPSSHFFEERQPRWPAASRDSSTCSDNLAPSDVLADTPTQSSLSTTPPPPLSPALQAYFAQHPEIPNPFIPSPAFSARYTLVDVLGQGASSFVLSAIRNSDSSEAAVKFIYKDRIPGSGWKKDRGIGKLVPIEVFILRRLQHRNVVRFLDVFEDATFFYMVMESVKPLTLPFQTGMTKLDREGFGYEYLETSSSDTNMEDASLGARTASETVMMSSGSGSERELSVTMDTSSGESVQGDMGTSMKMEVGNPRMPSSLRLPSPRINAQQQQQQQQQQQGPLPSSGPSLSSLDRVAEASSATSEKMLHRAKHPHHLHPHGHAHPHSHHHHSHHHHHQLQTVHVPFHHGIAAAQVALQSYPFHTEPHHHRHSNTKHHHHHHHHHLGVRDKRSEHTPVVMTSVGGGHAGGGSPNNSPPKASNEISHYHQQQQQQYQPHEQQQQQQQQQTVRRSLLRARKTSQDLFDCIERFPRLPELLAWSIFRQVADAVGYLHSRGFVHLDIKDENVILAYEPLSATSTTSSNGSAMSLDAPLDPSSTGGLCVKLIDFGSARPIPSETAIPDWFDFPSFQGTLPYAAPEILKGAMDSTGNTRWRGPPEDVYALGVLLFVLLEGTLPFPATQRASVVQGQLRLMAYTTARQNLYPSSTIQETDSFAALRSNGSYASLLAHGEKLGDVFKQEVAMRMAGAPIEGMRTRRSKACLDLVKGMLEPDVSKRLTMEEVLKHRWVVGGGKATSAETSTGVGGEEGG